jgi:hypothetical protein
MSKKILIYPHMPTLHMNDGGSVVQYNLAKILDEMNQNVMIFPRDGIKTENKIFNKFYNNEFLINDDVVVVYCEGTTGNPLGATNVVRWMLSVLGQNVPESWLETWDKKELVYYFNSETRFYKNLDDIGSIYKMLTAIYIDPCIKQTNFEKRNGTCYTFRKAQQIHKTGFSIIHPSNSFEITRDTKLTDYTEIFNQFKYFISYDSNTFLTIIATLCGCISIVYKVNEVTKKQWLNTTYAAEYLRHTGETDLYGVSYGQDDIDFAKSTIYLAKNQCDKIIKFNKEQTIIPFIHDINNFENMKNTIQNNYY